MYLENGNPKLGVRFVGDEVAEIQGQRNNSKIPLKYFDTFMEYQKKCNKIIYKPLILKINLYIGVSDKSCQILSKNHLGYLKSWRLNSRFMPGKLRQKKLIL